MISMFKEKIMSSHHMIPLIIFFIISFCCAHILIINNAFPFINTGNDEAAHIPRTWRVPGEDEKQSHTSRALILERLRSLLGLKSFSSSTTRKSRNEYTSYFFAPSPSPSPLPSGIGMNAPAPPPEMDFHSHAPRPSQQHHNSVSPPHNIILKKDRPGNKTKRLVTAVVASLGVTSALCAVGLFFGCRWILKKQEKRIQKINKFICKNSQSTVKKVSSDFFYLDTIQTALEPPGTGKSYFKEINTLVENKNVGGIKLPEESWSTCLGEITTVHEISESINHEPSSSNSSTLKVPEESRKGYDDNKLVHEESTASSSDDESFHSFCDIQNSSQVMLRLSNASETCSFGDTTDMLSEGDLSKQVRKEILQLQPPPPPPPPLFLPKPSSTTMVSNLTNQSTLPNLAKKNNVPQPPTPPPPSSSNVTPSQFIPLAKDGSPLPKLKPLHWDKVRAAPDRSTVWDKLRSSSFEFDEEMIESLFGYKVQNPMKNDDVRTKTPSPGKHVLDHKRLQNITILSKALNTTAEQVCGALIRGDGLSLQDLEALSKMEPTKEEEAKLLNYKGDILELGSVEKLVQSVLKIPFAFQRIEAMLYRETFDDEVVHLKKSFSMLEDACKELKSSRLFLKLLEAVLKTGNRMNVGTVRGEAKAFKLDALLKLADVKGTDSKTTLLHFVVQEIARFEGIRVSESIMGKINHRSNTPSRVDKEEDYRRMGLDLVSGLNTELCNVKKTATVDLDVLASSVANLSEGIRKLQQLVQKNMTMVEQPENFVPSMRSFLRYAELKLNELQEDENRVLLRVREITEYFHGDMSKDESNPLRIFVIVRDFLSMLDLVCKELRSSKAPGSANRLSTFR